MPTSHRRIQVTEDPELASALRGAAAFLPAGMSRAGQLRELALVGARKLTQRDSDESDRDVLLARLAARFRDPIDDAVDRDQLRSSKQRAWRAD